ncbi:RNA-processing protein [Candidatus Woesearchaeota archaeon]|nr:RNA-processing protein [Candidatus Woesearchaeota archaeon]|tara:strand:+ start:29861 stop:30406 length:546 start_codon:yes stop_codon:yes gene_type:complete
MEEYSYELKIPASRIAVLIGKEGSIKKKLETETGVKITIDSKEGDIFLYGDDALNLYTVREIITAIGRGFNPEIALQLLKPDYSLEQLNLNDYAKTKNHFIRIKGRVIGSNGKARQVIEELTDCKISVFGKTICIIGRVESVDVCRRAVEKLIAGSQHSTIYKMLERHRRNLKKQQLLGEA